MSNQILLSLFFAYRIYPKLHLFNLKRNTVPSHGGRLENSEYLCNKRVKSIPFSRNLIHNMTVVSYQGYFIVFKQATLSLSNIFIKFSCWLELLNNVEN